MPFPLPEAPVAGVTLQHHDDHVYINKQTNSTINSQSGTSYTLVLTDMFKVIETTSSSSVSITVPPNSSVAFPVGTVVEIVQLGTGVVTVVQGSGVTINTPGTLVFRAQYSSVAIRKRASDTWVLAGDTT
jgi:hypothetical protein